MAAAFEDARLGTIPIKNRIIRSATHEGMGDAEGYPVPALGDMYERLARGGVGAIVAGYAGVSPEGRTCRTMRMFDNDKYIDAYKPIVARVKAHGAAIIQQIAHGGAFSGMGLDNVDRVAPSGYDPGSLGAVARELRESEIERLIRAFVDGIVRVCAAGFDGVQLHAAHLYLLSQFLSPRVNKRQDNWGGSTENRFRIIGEIVSRARERVGDYPIFAKYSAYSLEKEGVTEEEGVRLAELFEAAGFDAIEISCGGMTDLLSAMRVPKTPVDPLFEYLPELRDLPRLKRAVTKLLFPLVVRPSKPLHNYNVSIAAKIKARISIPVVVVGGIRSLSDIEDILASGSADFVSMSRPFIHSPGLVNRMKTGKQPRSGCIDCGYCIFYCAEHPVRCLKGKLPSRSS